MIVFATDHFSSPVKHFRGITSVHLKESHHHPDKGVESIFSSIFIRQESVDDVWRWRIVLLSSRIHLLLDTHSGLSNLLPLAALSVSLSAPNGNLISAVRVPFWIILTVLSVRRRKMSLFICCNRSLYATRSEAQWIYSLKTWLCCKLLTLSIVLRWNGSW